MLLIKTFDAVRRSRFAAPLAIAAAFVLLAANEMSHQRASAIIRSVDEALVARVEINRLLRVMLGAESGQRGYLLTGRNEYREPYAQAVAEIETLMTKIRRAYEGSSRPAAEARQLEELTRQKLSELDTTLKLYDEGKEQAWRELLLTDLGREQMRALEQLAEGVTAQETAQHDVLKSALRHTLLLQRIGIAVLVLLSLAALLLYLRQTNRYFVASAEQRALLQAERDKLETEVERRTRDLTEIARHLQTAREDERSRLARELHDELGGLLTAAKLDVTRLRSKLSGAEPSLQEGIARLIRNLDEGIAIKRRIIEDLHPSSLQNLGLKVALETLASEFAARSGLTLEADIDDVPLEPNASLSVYRMVQEGLTNVSKYASARRVRVNVGREQDAVRVSVEDDGNGFDPDSIKPGTHGLAGMRFRIESHGGRLDVRSAQGAGTTITALIPLSADAGVDG
jgi:signal transduction histidine kinase